MIYLEYSGIWMWYLSLDMFTERFPGQSNWQEAGQQQAKSCSHLILPGCHHTSSIWNTALQCACPGAPVHSLSPRAVGRACSEVLLLRVCCLTPLHSGGHADTQGFGVLGNHCTDLISSSMDNADPTEDTHSLQMSADSLGDSHFWASPTCYPLACCQMSQTLMSRTSHGELGSARPAAQSGFGNPGTLLESSLAQIKLSSWAPRPSLAVKKEQILSCLLYSSYFIKLMQPDGQINF